MSAMTDDRIRADAHLWRARIADGLDANEQQEFDNWLRSNSGNFEAFAEAEAFWGRVGQTQLLSSVVAEFARTGVVDENIATSADAQTGWFAGFIEAAVASLGRLIGAAVTVAACAVVFFAIGGIDWLSAPGPQPGQQFATIQGEKRIINLPDRSRIILGAASQLEITLNEDARTVRLIDGDAYFDVTRNAQRPFIVSTEIATIEVTGTRFDARMRDEALDVSVGEGSVRLSATTSLSGEERTVDLIEGQAVRASVSDGIGAIQEVFPAEFAAWRSGRLIYIRTPLSEVIDEINRYSDEPIILGAGVGSIEFSGTFDADNIEGLLQSIDEGSPVRIIHRDNERVIVRN